MTTLHQEAQAQYEKLLAVGKLLAERLTGITDQPWTCQPRKTGNGDCPPNWLTVNGPDEQVIGISFADRDDSRLCCSGHYPNDPDAGGFSEIRPWDSERRELDNPTDRITVAASKTPEQIARDIAHRLLPGYVNLLAKVKERRRQVVQYRDRQAEAAKLLLAAAGDLTVNPYHPESGVTTFEQLDKQTPTIHLYTQAKAGGFNGDVKNINGNNCDLELCDVPLDLAQFILKLLRDTKRKASK